MIPISIHAPVIGQVARLRNSSNETLSLVNAMIFEITTSEAPLEKVGDEGPIESSQAFSEHEAQ
jgi:hypothetical protein